MKVCELDATEKQKMALSVLNSPRTIAELAGRTNVTYTTAGNWLRVWFAKGWIKKIPAVQQNMPNRWRLNSEILEI